MARMVIKETDRTVHNINNTTETSFNQKQPPARTITVTLNMSKSFDTVNIDNSINKLIYNILTYLAASQSSLQATSR